MIPAVGIHMCQVASVVSDFCEPIDCSLPGSVHGILQARILEWVAVPSPSPLVDLPHPGIKPVSPMSPALVGKSFTTNAIWEAS